MFVSKCFGFERFWFGKVLASKSFCLNAMIGLYVVKEGQTITFRLKSIFVNDSREGKASAPFENVIITLSRIPEFGVN